MRRFAFHRASCILAAIVALFVTPTTSTCAGEALKGINNPIHQYWTLPANDRFTRLHHQIESGQVTLPTENDRAFLSDLLRRLQVPESSQLLVSSTTSLQKRLINPRNPRAIYFNEDTYVGYVPRGQIEVASLDPELGTILYSFDRIRTGQVPHVKRDAGCMNCHSPRYLDDIPALVIESVVPGMTGGGEKAFRRQQSGHGVRLEDRFGGWIVTGAPDSWQHWGNIVMEYDASGRHERHVHPGELFDFNHYLAPTSDILPHLLHEHQVGFVNRALHASYAFREWRTTGMADNGKLPAEETECVLEALATPLVDYLLFADEVPLPSGGILGDPLFKAAFLTNKRLSQDGHSLKDLNLEHRLFQNRCSYMIYSVAFTGLPTALKERVYLQLQRALADDPPTRFSYLPQDERRRIRRILSETISEFGASAAKTNVAQNHYAIAR